VIVILNCRAGPAQRKASPSEMLSAALSRHGIAAELWCAEDGPAIGALVERAVASGDDTIVAAGGDGTINAVASAVVDRPIRLGVLPFGTLNHFAKDAGIPVALDPAVQLLVKGQEHQVDVGEVNGRIFLNNSSLGLYPRIVRHRAEQQERLGRGKWPAFTWALLSVLRICPSLRLHLDADGERTVTRTPFLFVGNNAYRMDIIRIGARDRLDGGALSVYYARNYGRWGVVSLALRSLLGRVTQAENFESRAVHELLVDAAHERKIDVSTDGEVRRMELPLRYRTRPRALRVIGPPAAA
jgi:diacylglycerol kinase family enzyme